MKIAHVDKFLGLLLRHKPHLFNIHLDENGWASVSELIERSNEHDVPLNLKLLEKIVESNDNDNQRFSFNDDYTKIRANQRYSVKIDLSLQPTQPPEKLYHGTIPEFLEAIKNNGLKKMSRQHVHLSTDPYTAFKIAERKGKPVILVIDAAKMQEDGFIFYLSVIGVWFTYEIPNKYITVLN